MRYSIGTAKRVAAITAALYLATLAVATGGDFSPQHFLFAVPIYVACFASLVVRGSTRPSQGFTLAVLAFVSCLLILNSLDVSHRYNWPELESANANNEPVDSIGMGPKAHQLDALMTACAYSRYFITGDPVGGLQGLTLHSPYQLGYGLLRAESQRTLYFTDGKPNPYFHSKLVRDFAEAPLLVTDAKSAEDFPYPELRKQFTKDFSPVAPACARSFLPISGVSVFFRKPHS